MFKKNKEKNQFSRVHRNHEDGLFHVDGMGVTILCVIVLGGLGIFGAKAYQHHKVVNSQNQTQTVSPEASNQLSCKIKTKPNAKIFADGNQVGNADKNGTYDLDAVKIGTKITTKYGPSKSMPMILTKSNNHGTVKVTFNYLNQDDAQENVNNLYQSITSLANNNDQTSDNGTLEDFYVGGNDNTSYKDMFKWSKAQYKEFQQNQSDNSDDDDMADVSALLDKKQQDSTGDTHDDKTKSQVKPQAKITQSNQQDGYDSVHFVAHVKGTSLNEDGTVNVKYTLKNDFAGKKHDHIEVYNWTAVMKKKGSHWKIVKATSAPKPTSVYED